jgi:hypothetical protein
MFRVYRIARHALLAAMLSAAALGSALARAQDAGDFRDGYAKGYKDGFDAGYQKALAEQRAAVEAAAKNAPIVVISAMYGPENSGKRCDASRYIRKEANGRRNASVPITNDMCGDPAPGERKRVEVTYLCAQVTKTANAYEHRSVYLSCD